MNLKICWLLRHTDEAQKGRNSCLWLQSRSVLSSFGVLLMSCRVNFLRSTISIAVFCLQNLICLHCYFCWSDPTFFGIFVCDPLQSFMVNVCTMWVSLFFFFKIVKNSHVKTTHLICWPLDRTSKLKLQQKCIKNIICKKSLIKQNIINIRLFKYENSGTFTGDRKNGLVTIPEVFAKVLIGPSFFQVSKVMNGQGFSLVTVNHLYH